MFVRALAVGLALFIGDAVAAPEVSAFMGATGGETLSTRSYFGWMLEYLQGFHRDLAWSFAALDEGHFHAHHRDGYAAQLWARTTLVSPGLMVALGAGPYLTFDTIEIDDHGTYIDKHGLAIVYSAVGSWQATDHWLVQVRVNRVQARSGPDSTAYLLGVGYRFDDDSAREVGGIDSGARREQVALLIGGTKNNSIKDESAFSGSLEYRHLLGRDLEWTASLIDEGDTSLTHRRGLASQLWVAPRFFDGRLGLGIGAGPYIAHDVYRTDPSPSNSKNTVAGLLTLTADYRFTENWFTRLSWNRVVTNYNRDADVTLLGIGYMF